MKELILYLLFSLTVPHPVFAGTQNQMGSSEAAEAGDQDTSFFSRKNPVTSRGPAGSPNFLPSEYSGQLREWYSDPKPETIVRLRDFLKNHSLEDMQFVYCLGEAFHYLLMMHMEGHDASCAADAVEEIAARKPFSVNPRWPGLVATLLRESDPEKRIDLLIDALEDPQSRVLFEAILVLPHVIQDRHRDRLRSLAQNPASWGGSGGSLAAFSPGQVAWQLWMDLELRGKTNREAFEILAEELGTSRPFLSGRASEASKLLEMGGSEVVPTLMEVLEEGNSWAVLWTWRILARLDDPAGNEALFKSCVSHLGDPDRLVWSTAAKKLADLGNPEAVPPLIEQLNRRNERGLFSVAQALGSLGDASAIDPLQKRLQDCEDPESTPHIARALHDLGDPSGLEWLLETARSGAGPERNGALNQLAQMKEMRAVPVLINLLRHAENPMRALYPQRKLEEITGRKFETASQWEEWWENH